MAFSFPQKPAGTPAFGQASTFGTPQQSSGLPFGSPAAGAVTQPQFGGGNAFQFSNTAASTPPAGFGFSAAPNMTAPAYNFSTPQKSAFGTPVAAPTPAFGAAAAATTAFGATAPTPAFGAAAATPMPAFGAAAAAPMPTFGAAAATPMPAFGAAAATPTPAFGAAAAAPMPAFGAAQPTQGLFGTPASSSAQASTGFGFGSTAPTGGGLTFGTPTTSAPVGFGATTSGGSAAFGTPATLAPTPAFGGFGAATPVAPAFGALGGFGAAPTSTAPGGYSLGATAPASLTPGTGLTFGAPAAVSSAPLTGFGLGGAPASTPSTGLTFGTPSASSAPGIGLTSAPTTGPTFNTPASSQAPATALTFGTPASSAPATVGLNFGTPVSSAAPSKGLTFGTPASTTGLQFGAATTANTLAATAPASSATGLSFTAGTTSAASTLFGLASTTTASTATSLSTGLSFGLGSTTIKPLTTTTTTTGFSLGLAPPATTSTATALSAIPVGLGGITEAKTPTTTTGQPEVPPRDQPLPNELQQAVEEFKKYIKAQKQYSSDISRFSVKDLKSVATDIDLVGKKLVEMENELKKNSTVAQQLKGDMAKSLQHMELAQRTFDTPNALQYDNNAPLNYFVDLADGFERDMFSMRAQIENVDKYLKNLSNPATLTSNDLSIGLRRLHETFVTLAGQLQLVHNRVSIQKQQYLDLRKRALNDHTDVFEDKAKPKVDPFEIEFQDVYRPPAVSVGPTPFSSFGSSQAQVVAQNTPPPYARVQAPASSALPSAVPLFGNSTFNLSFQPSTNTSSQSSFQLQKPPIGNKRGRN